MLCRAGGLRLRVRAQQVCWTRSWPSWAVRAITFSEVENTARRLTESRREQGYTSDRDPMNEALEQLMMQKLLYNQALIDSVEIAKTDIMARVEEEVQDMIAREGTIPAVESKMHNPIFTIRENLRRRYEEAAYASAMQREVIGKVTIIPGRGRAFLPPDRQGQSPSSATSTSTPISPSSPSRSTRPKRRARERLLEMRERIITATPNSNCWPASTRSTARRCTAARWSPRRCRPTYSPLPKRSGS